MSSLESRLMSVIRDVPDFPKPGIVFKDITPVLARPDLMNDVTAHFVSRYAGKVDAVVGMESRGFIFGTPIALALGAAFVPARKPGKLPYERISEEYDLEYGTAALEIPAEGVALAGRTVAIIDDVLATGGTLAASWDLLITAGAVVTVAAVVIELAALGGRERLAGLPVRSLQRV